jgi:AAT family amino acid transporter
MILISHLSFRRHHDARTLPVRMPLFPWMQYFGLLMLAAVLITMGLDTKFYYVSWLVGIPWMLLISGAYFLWARLQRK